MVVAAVLAFLAVQPAPALAAAPAGQEERPANTCRAPELPQRSSLDAPAANRISEAAQAYVECVSTYVEARRARVQAMIAEAQAENEGLNAATSEANAFVQRFNAWQEEPIAGGEER